ncbi:MAG: hypothetical protein IKD22_00575 [Lentisphaeria bacterium]|nr:hypothetical protein [Lentisphaeria bacterium]
MKKESVSACYGKYLPASAECKACPWQSSCEYYTATAASVESRSHLSSFEAMQDWHAQVADFDHIPGEEVPEERSADILAMLSRFFRYLLELDAYSIGVICEVILPRNGKSCTVSALGKLHGCSRQAMHRKILAMIAAHPELAVLLKKTMYKLTESRELFLRHRKQPGDKCRAV